MEEVPAVVRQAAVAQGVAGLVTLGLTWWVAALGLGLLCGLPTFGLGLVCGYGALILLPLGALELLSGLLVWTDPRAHLAMMRWVARFELASVFLGNVVSGLVGGVVLSILRSEEVHRCLEG